jgi:hypothetical protein
MCPGTTPGYGSRKTYTTPAKTSAAAHAQIKAIYKELNEDEQKKLMDTLEETGF